MKKHSRWLDAPAAFALRALAGLFGGLPPAICANAGALIGAGAHAFLPLRREVVRRNLDIAFGQTHTIEERRRIERAAYRCFGMMAAEWLGLWRNGPQWAQSQVQEIENPSYLEDLLRGGKGFLVSTAHFGNWELLGAYFGSKVKMSILAKPMHNRQLDEELCAMRRRYGIELISTSLPDLPQKIAQAARERHAICFLADQDARKSGFFTPFFGRPASTFLGPALYAMRLKLPILSGFLLRLGPGRHRVVLREPIQPLTGIPLRAAIEELTRRHVKITEDVIRLAPSQYFWFHRRWKTPPPAQSPPPQPLPPQQAKPGI